MPENLMKRVFLALLCSVALMASGIARAADPAADKDMADRYTQAAQSGDSDAQFYLGALYSAGVGRPRSDQMAFQWFSRAADQGHSHAMLILGGLYAIGRGTPKNNLNAYKWAYIVSLGTRVEEFRNGARQLLGVLDAKMTRNEVSQAKDEAGRWHAVKSSVSVDNAPPSSVSKPQPANSPPPPPAEKKSDMDDIMDKIPSELRKRFGF
jgi:TPR repeat protein